MRSLVLGLLLLVFLSITILSLRPGGLRRQLGFAARRLRIVLILGGIYLVATTAIRIAFPEGWVADWGPPALALGLALVFAVIGQDPPAAGEAAGPPTRP